LCGKSSQLASPQISGLWVRCTCEIHSWIYKVNHYSQEETVGMTDTMIAQNATIELETLARFFLFVWRETLINYINFFWTLGRSIHKLFQTILQVPQDKRMYKKQDTKGKRWGKPLITPKVWVNFMVEKSLSDVW
jgi:hypothetical protein